MANPQEIAVLTVNGQRYRDWKTVLVHLNTMESSNYFRFTVSEGTSVDGLSGLSAFRIRPGDKCTVTLGGHLAIDGYVMRRQVAYNATHHGVELTGKTLTVITETASPQKPKEYRQQSFTSIATDLLKQQGINLITQGTISSEPFERVSVYGRSFWEVLQEIANARNITLQASPWDGGKSMLAAGLDASQGNATVREGVNILEGRETMSLEVGLSGPPAYAGNHPSNDKKWGPETTHSPWHDVGKGLAANFGTLAGIAGAGAMGAGLARLVDIAEHPALKNDIGDRARIEHAISRSEAITAQIVVQGWFTGKGDLWLPFMQVHVDSPMLLLNEPLKCTAVTFTQDDRSGSRTLLDLANQTGEYANANSKQ